MEDNNAAYTLRYVRSLPVDLVRSSQTCEDINVTTTNRQLQLIDANEESCGDSIRSSISTKLCPLVNLSRCDIKKYFTIKLCMYIILLMGVFKLILGSLSVVTGQTAIILAEEDDLHWGGIFLILGGGSSLLCAAWSFRIICRRSNLLITSKQIHAINFVVLYLFLFDIIVVIMLSSFNNEQFQVDIEHRMNDTLKLRYEASSPQFTEKWDNIQKGSYCCGAYLFSDWFDSAWSHLIRSKDDLPDINPIPLSCRLHLKLSGPCAAIAGTPKNSSPSYISLSNLATVSTCDFAASVQLGTIDYIHAAPCSPIYALELSEDMKVAMLYTVGLALVDLLVIIVLYKVAMKLPSQQRIHVYDANL